MKLQQQQQRNRLLQFTTTATTATTASNHHKYFGINHYNNPSNVHKVQSFLSMSKTIEGEAEEGITDIGQEMVSKHKKQSDSIMKENENENENDDTVNQHLKHQQEMFDTMSDFFNSEDATPDEVKPSLSLLMNQVLSEMIDCHEQGVVRYHSRKGDNADNDNDDDDDEDATKKQNEKDFKILDVGCGVGALFPFYLKQAKKINENINLHIMGLDLSPKMIEYAKTNSNTLLEETNTKGKHSFDFDNGDFVQLALGEGYYSADSEVVDDDTIVDFGQNIDSNEQTEKHRGKYDAVVINACFGNFYDSDAVLSAASHCLKNDGILAITHPLGAPFVKKLHTEDPKTVPHNLPSKEQLDYMISTSSQPLDVLQFMEESTTLEKNSQVIYYASAKKVPQRILQKMIYLRGPVDNGYGRGGKKLGIPTANLPCSLFANALQNVPTGVYFGWALIEGDDDDDDDKKKAGRNELHKAVVNVGYSPTFDGEENKEKIVEAHLIVNDGDIEGDFYGETMRLSLHGFLRPEMKFESFPALIEAIMNDKANAKDALDLPYYKECKNDSFLSSFENAWVGSSGGDKNASYEFSSGKN